MLRTNEMLELEFKGAAPIGSEVKVDMRALFTANGKTKEVLGFYSGNDTYKVRFLPEEAGEYNYKVSGVVRAEGSFTIGPSDDRHHGVVRPEGTHLRHADGTYITTFGTTVYALAHQNDEITEETFKSLGCGAFNKIRICVFPKNYEYNRNDHRYFPFYFDENAEDIDFIDNLGNTVTRKPIDVHHPCMEFWNEFETKLNRLSDMGIQVDLILFHPYDRWGHSRMSQKDNLVYLDYVIRRLAAYPNIWWSIANEYDIFPVRNPEEWYEIDGFIGTNDIYHHMLSNHNCFKPYDFSRKYITHISLQNRFTGRVYELQKRFGKPVLYDECAYEGNLKETWGSISAKEMTNRFWQVTVTGGFCTHGEVLLDDDIVTKEQQDNAVLWWAKGGKLKGESPKRIKYLRDFVETLPGVIDAYPVGLPALASVSKEAIRAALPFIPEHNRVFAESMASLDEREMIYQNIHQIRYTGHVGEEVYIFYLGTDCCARFKPFLPSGRTFSIEIMDVWNMTSEKIAAGIKNGDEIRLPGREYIAVIARAE